MTVVPFIQKPVHWFALIYKANQRTGFYMIGTIVMKELINFKINSEAIFFTHQHFEGIYYCNPILHAFLDCKIHHHNRNSFLEWFLEEYRLSAATDLIIRTPLVFRFKLFMHTWCAHRKTSKACLTIFQHFAWKG